ncbi:MAG: glycine cleavage system protein GcvH [Sphaerochaetaceae bacterium]|nr:glycine cleavage system protein GcvH [Sphaerochaetaceae bacterium]
MSGIPGQLKYSKEHEWVRLDGNLAYVGITDYAQESLGEVVFVEFPEVGEQLEADQEIANIESVKAASAIYNPIRGTVDSVNEELTDAPELINEDCYAHHLYILKDFDMSQFEQLLDASSYIEYLETL